MPAKVLLRVTKGKLQGKEFAFDERSTCVMGRADDCHPQLPRDKDHQTISRHHCLLDINPPDIRIRDFGSLNGTFVNGEKIGQREKGQTPEEGAKFAYPEHDLAGGDEIKLGSTVVTVNIFVPTFCTECSREIPEDFKAKAERAPGIYQCDECRVKAEKENRKDPPKKRPKVCSRCGADVSEEVGDNRQGDFICARCKTDPWKTLQPLLEQAEQGDTALLPIRGFKTLKELGKGGMGAVYLARHDKTGEQVAIKVMLPQVASDERSTEMFLRETENTRALNHPHVVRVRGAGYSQGLFFLTLEYCEGGSVAQLIENRGGKLPLDEAIEITFQCLEGLEYAHKAEIPYVKLAAGGFGPGRGLVHRDIKPGNLLLSGAGSSRIAKVGDYGLAKAFELAGLSGQTLTGQNMGTPGYMPKQQLNFKYAKPEVDVWAMAASLYAMLTGKVPRNFPKGRDPFLVVLQDAAVPIRERDSKIPKKLAKVIDNALVDTPAICFKRAADFKQALEDAV